MKICQILEFFISVALFLAFAGLTVSMTLGEEAKFGATLFIYLIMDAKTGMPF